MLTHASIKERTSSWHAKVDQLFSTFDLSQRAPYTSFLRANASAIVPLEYLLLDVDELPSWDPRSSFLLEDLEALNGTESASLCPKIPMVFPSYGAQLGALYVLEGSKFGASVLNDRVGSGLPRGFLSVCARPNRWRGLLSAIDAAAFARPPEWMDEVVSGATNAFDLFATSALKEAHSLRHTEGRDWHTWSISLPSVVV